MPLAQSAIEIPDEAGAGVKRVVCVRSFAEQSVVNKSEERAIREILLIEVEIAISALKAYLVAKRNPELLTIRDRVVWQNMSQTLCKGARECASTG